MSIRIPNNVDVGVKSAFQEIDSKLDKLKTDVQKSVLDLSNVVNVALQDLNSNLAISIKKAIPGNFTSNQSGIVKPAGSAQDGAGNLITDELLREDNAWVYQTLLDASDIGQADAIKRYNLNGGLIVNGPLDASSTIVSDLSILGTLNLSNQTDAGWPNNPEEFLREDGKWVYDPLLDASDIGQTDAIKRYNLNGGLIVNGPLDASATVVSDLSILGNLSLDNQTDVGWLNNSEEFLREDGKWAYELLSDASNIGQTDAINRYNLQGGLIAAGPITSYSLLADVVTAADINSNPPRARVTHSATQVAKFTTGNAVAVALDTDLINIGAVHNTATNNTRLTMVKAGWWAFGGSIEMSANAAGTYRQVYIGINGGTPAAILQIGPPGAATSPRLSCSSTRFFNLNDYIELIGQQDSGANLDCTKQTEWSPIFWAYWICP